MGIFSVPSLKGLLGAIPITTTSKKDTTTIQRTREKIYEIATPTGERLETVIINEDDVKNNIAILYEKYKQQYGEIVITAWEKNYLTSMNSSTFSTCTDRDCII